MVSRASTTAAAPSFVRICSHGAHSTDRVPLLVPPPVEDTHVLDRVLVASDRTAYCMQTPHREERRGGRGRGGGGGRRRERERESEEREREGRRREGGNGGKGGEEGREV